jgi:hypothetical protein
MDLEIDMPTTLSDFGRDSEKHGDIPFYYAFPIKFYFGNSQLEPDDVLTWCRENTSGYYKVVCYTHKSSVRNKHDPRKFDKKVLYVDKIYLSDNKDATYIKLAYKVTKTVLRRSDKIKRLKTEA